MAAAEDETQLTAALEAAKGSGDAAMMAALLNDLANLKLGQVRRLG